MDLRLDRNRIFVLVGALEEDLRRIIDLHLLTKQSVEETLGPAYERAVARANSDPHHDTTQASLLHYLDLGDAIEILNRHRDSLPDFIAQSVKSHTMKLETLIPVRNRVMHWRPLLTDDAISFEQTMRSLIREGFDGDQIRETLKRLEHDPDWSPSPPPPASSSRVLHNLPLPDFDETGLVGRMKAVKELTSTLIKMGKTGRNPVLTIVGPGGLGKTALALQALHNLVEDEECPFDVVSWVSLKTEKLSHSGVQQLVNSVRSLEEALPLIAEVLDTSVGDSLSSLSEAIKELDIRPLFVIDNLETVSAGEVLDLIDALPDNCTYLITSREGLGQVERRFPISPLDTKSATQLMRATFRARHLHEYAKMDEATTQAAVESLGCSPLGIKWFVSGVEVGRDPEELLAHQDDLIRFCVENVFESLIDTAKRVARVLVVREQSTTFPELHTFLPDISSDHLRRAMQSLLNRMLVTRSLVDGSLAEAYDAHPILVQFLEKFDPSLDEESQRVQRLDDEWRRSEDRFRIHSDADPLRPNVLQGVDEHRGAAYILREALDLSRGQNIKEAINRTERAEELDAEYWEIFRVRGFLLSRLGHVQTATSAFERARQLAPDARARAIVDHYYAGHLMRVVRDSIKASEIARESHEQLQSAKSATLLGTALTFVHRFSEAEELLSIGSNDTDHRTRLIASTQLIECLRRHAEHDAAQERNADNAFENLLKALEIADRLISEGHSDGRMLEKALEVASEYVLIFSRQHDDSRKDELLRVLEFSHRTLPRSPHSKAITYLRTHLQRIIDRHSPELRGVGVVLELLSSTGSEIKPEETTDNRSSELVDAVVKAWKPDGQYGFISVEGWDHLVYTHVSELDDQSQAIWLGLGTQIKCVVSHDDAGRTRARSLRVTSSTRQSLHSCLVVVRMVSNGNGFLLANDTYSGATVFVGRHTVGPDVPWPDLVQGSMLVADVELDDQGRFRAIAGTVKTLDTQITQS